MRDSSVSVSTASPPPAAGPQRKLLGSLRIKLRIAAACAAVLILGAWLRPRTAAPLTPPAERPAPLLDEQVQQRVAADFRGIEAAVARLPVRGVVVQPNLKSMPIAGDFGAPVPPAPPVFAVAVSDSHVVTHVAAMAGSTPPTITTADGAQWSTSIAAFDMTTRLLLLNSPAPVAASPAFADAIAQPGSLVVGAARSHATDVAIPLFVTSASGERYGIGGIAQSAPPGLPIYDLDGGLLAVSAGDGTAWRIRYALDRLLSQAAAASLPSSIGIAFQVIGEPLAAAMGTTGLAIVDVAPGGPADAAGVAIGDVITRIGATSAKGGGALPTELAALPAGTPVELSLRRGRRDLTVSVTPAFAHEMATLAAGPPTAAPRADVVFVATALAAASVPADATVMMINGRPVTSAAQAAREVRRISGAAVTLLDHRGRRFFASIDARP
jgi:hypothetical protein